MESRQRDRPNSPTSSILARIFLFRLSQHRRVQSQPFGQYIHKLFSLNSSRLDCWWFENFVFMSGCCCDVVHWRSVLLVNRQYMERRRRFFRCSWEKYSFLCKWLAFAHNDSERIYHFTYIYRFLFGFRCKSHTDVVVFGSRIYHQMGPRGMVLFVFVDPGELSISG